MTKYYFVGTLLTPLSFNATPEISFAELITILHDNLSAKDYAKTLVIRTFYDIINLRSLWLREEFDPFGYLTITEIEDALFIHEGLPDYVYDFLELYEKTSDRLHHFPYLLTQFFRGSATIKDPFLKDYLNFERELRLVLTAFRAKKLGRDLSIELQYEDPEEEFIAQLLSQKDAAVYDPPEQYQEVKLIFEKYTDDPLSLQRAIDQYRMIKIDSLVDMGDVFSIERILAYLLQLIIIEKWVTLNREKGLKIIETIAKEGS